MPDPFRNGRMTVRAARMRARIIVCAASLLALSVIPATADTCSDLEAQLSAASRTDNGFSAKAARYADAATRQAAEIEKTRAIQEAQGCFRNPTAGCQALNRTIQQMQSNLDQLERQRDRLAGNRNNEQRLRAIQARLKANRCDEPQRVVRQQINGPQVTMVQPDDVDPRRVTRVIVRDGIGRKRIHEAPQDGPAVFDNPDAITVPQMSGTFRTLCVRTCDGYYFPVSFSTTSDFFERDAKACAAMCPAAETKLYFHRVPDQESEAMISLKGEPYTALPTAFLYRQRPTDQADPSCTCGKPRTEANFRADEDADQPKPLAAGKIPTPSRRPDGLADPESQMNAATGLTKDRIREMTGAVNAGEAHAADTSRKVRVVGPEFLPDPEEAIDLRSPAPTSFP
ncbi:DUF2865 domain-containing protein [Oricola nitratireducens]|uniref:DUF2865 domain-containing protein n=1 Tax=Oricola nitratireducens TaxID=2775868 RepID=UPI0018684AFF